MLLSAIVPYTPTNIPPQNIPNPSAWVLRMAFGSDFVKWLAVRVFPDATIKSMFGTSNDTMLRKQQQQILDTMLPARERFEGFVRDLKAMREYQLIETELENISCPILFLATTSDASSPLEYNRLPITQRQRQPATEIIRDKGTHMLLDDIPVTKAEIETFLQAHPQ